jgi:hypothetical protein
MKKIILATCALLFLSSSIYPQGYSSYSLKGLRIDYQQSSVAAHVRILRRELADKIGYYAIYRVTSRVVEPFKGRVKKGQRLIYYIQTEDVYDKYSYRGEKVVFLENPVYRKENKIWSYQTIENSDREARREVISMMRRIKSSRSRRTRFR